MGELVVGKPALQLNFAVSLPLDLVSSMSLLYRAVPGSGLDPWLVETRRALPTELRDDLDLLHGFTGRLLYYIEEPIMRFGPLRDEHLDAGFDDLIAFLESQPASEYQAMLTHAVDRVHRDLGTGLVAPPPTGDEAAWRAYLEPGLTTARGDDVLELVFDANGLKQRTLRLMRGVWDHVYQDEYAARLPVLREAKRQACGTASRGFGMAFSDLTGNRLPSTLVAGLNDVDCVTFCPSYHLGSFVSYILYPPDLVIFFGTHNVTGQPEPEPINGFHLAEATPNPPNVPRAISDTALLEAIRALGDSNRLRILDLLSGGELYAQEIVGRLGIAQSAVSRHLSLLERAGLVSVRPRRGMKYYAVNAANVEAVANAIRSRAHG